MCTPCLKPYTQNPNSDRQRPHIIVSLADVGPLKWMSPESLLQKVYGPKTDSWVSEMTNTPTHIRSHINTKARTGTRTLTHAHFLTHSLTPALLSLTLSLYRRLV